MNKTKPYARVWWRGHQFDERTKSALVWSEQHYLLKKNGKPRGKNRRPFSIGQGSYADGSLSAGTHSGGGAVDIGFAGLNMRQRRAVVYWMKRAGFAAWAREGAAWGTNNDHAHAILPSRTNSAEAKSQVASYRRGRSGLAGDGIDPTLRLKPMPRWSHRANTPRKGRRKKR